MYDQLDKIQDLVGKSKSALEQKIGGVEQKIGGVEQKLKDVDPSMKAVQSAQPIAMIGVLLGVFTLVLVLIVLLKGNLTSSDLESGIAPTKKAATEAKATADQLTKSAEAAKVTRDSIAKKLGTVHASVRGLPLHDQALAQSPFKLLWLLADAQQLAYAQSDSYYPYHPQHFTRGQVANKGNLSMAHTWWTKYWSGVAAGPLAGVLRSDPRDTDFSAVVTWKSPAERQFAKDSGWDLTKAGKPIPHHGYHYLSIVPHNKNIAKRIYLAAIPTSTSRPVVVLILENGHTAEMRYAFLGKALSLNQFDTGYEEWYRADTSNAQVCFYVARSTWNDIWASDARSHKWSAVQDQVYEQIRMGTPN